jgi:hypothetical protein
MFKILAIERLRLSGEQLVLGDLTQIFWSQNYSYHQLNQNLVLSNAR